MTSQARLIVLKLVVLVGWAGLTAHAFQAVLGRGFCVVRSQVFREVQVTDFAWFLNGKGARECASTPVCYAAFWLQAIS
jgi:hypothetical protein